MSKQEVLSIGRRIKERKWADLSKLQNDEYNKTKAGFDAAHDKVCRPQQEKINRAIKAARAALETIYGKECIDSYQFPCEITNSPHSLIGHYSKSEQVVLDGILKKYHAKQDALVAAFDDFEMAVLTDGAEGALKAFIAAVKKL